MESHDLRGWHWKSKWLYKNNQIHYTNCRQEVEKQRPMIFLLVTDSCPGEFVGTNIVSIPNTSG